MIEIHRTEIDGVPTFWVDSGRPSLSAVLMFRAGMVDEPPHRAGWLHLLEHVAMRGSDQHGLNVNASVDLTMTSFDADGDPAEVCEHLRRVVERLRTVPETDLDAERAVLRAEDRERSGSPLDLGLAWRFGAYGPARSVFHGMGVDAADASALRELSARLFTRENAVLALSAPPPAGLALPLGSGSPQALPELPPMLAPSGCYVHPLDGVVLHGVVDRGASAQVMTSLLGHRLRESLRHREGMTYAPDSDYIPVSPTKAIVVAAGPVNGEDVERASMTMLATIDDLLHTGPDPDELRRIRAERERDASDPHAAFSWACAAAARQFDGRTEPYPAHNVEELAQVTPASVQAIVTQFIGTSMLGVSVPSARRAIPLPALEDPKDPAPITPRATFRTIVPLPGSPVVRTFDGGLHVQHRDNGVRVDFSDVLACRATPSGIRLIVRGDATVVEIPTANYHHGDQLRAHVDAGVDPRVVVATPDPDQDEPSPTRRELGSGLLGALMWVALAVAVVGGFLLHRVRPDLVSTGSLGFIVGVALVVMGAQRLLSWRRRRP